MEKSVIFIVAQNNFRDEELLVPQRVLESRKIRTAVAARTREKAIGKLGAEVRPEYTLADIKANDFDGIVFVGGPGAMSYFEDDGAWGLARSFAAAKKIVGAICIAPTILANAGLLMGRKVTAFYSEEETLKRRGAEFTGMSVEVDGNFITASGPEAAQEFGEKIAWELGM